jgi:tetratricopeptide (TPR) repeat protein
MTGRACIVAIMLAGIAGCASSTSRPAVPAPVVTAFPAPAVPAGLAASPQVRARHEAAWRKLQTGDTRGASRDFSAIIRQAPGFYPSIVGLGFVDLAGRDYKNAAARFTAATRLDERYLPAWLGLSDAALGMNDDATAIGAMERALALDPAQTALKSRLDLVRFRRVQALITDGRAARTAGRFVESKRLLEDALALSPSSAAILRELVATDTDSGDLASAEMHARRATAADPRDAEGWMVLAGVLDAAGRPADAAAAAARAIAIDPRQEWREAISRYREKANAAVLPPGFANLRRSATVTRAEAAAFVGLELDDVLSRSRARSTGVITDIRGHWASQWILDVTRTGVMDIYPNHTFQPAATVRRSDLARMASALLGLAATGRPAELQRWRASRPAFADMPGTHAAYRAAAVAVASGAMSTAGGRFEPTRPATGAELDAMVARISQLAH